MTQSLLTGATGLLAHQKKLETVSNNIANLNTTGYKSQRMLFSDLVYSDLRSAIGPGANNGGVNPTQIGHGVQVSQINKNFTQGVLSDTGSEFDFALVGSGFFVLEGNQQQFTRDGSFSVNNEGFLIDPATGSYVQRTGSVGESTATAPGFQAPGDTRINIPLGASVPGQATTAATLFGNLPASAEPALAEILTTSTPLTVGGSPATSATLLNDLDLNNLDYILGDSIDIVGTDVDGSSFSTSLAAGPATTLGDLTTAINGALTGASVSLSTDGNLLLTANQPGDALLSLSLVDNAGNTGQTDFVDAAMVIGTDGKDADVVETTMQVFDSRGEPHTLNVAFEKQDFNTWDATFTPADGSLQLSDGEINGITFAENGTFQTTNGTGLGDTDIEMTITSLTGTQTVQFSLDRLTHLATNFTATYNQDGFSPGTIVKMEVSADGTLSGVATNGRRLEVAQMAIARFANEQGLENIGDNFFLQSSSSGIPDIGGGNANGRGSVRGGQLENSNVDVALEFAQLIIAQRGFSANARTISIASEVLQELTNIF